MIFTVLTTSGVVLWFDEKNQVTTFIHTFFAALFLVITGFHVNKNLKSLIRSLNLKVGIFSGTALAALVILIVTGFSPFREMMHWNARQKALRARTLQESDDLKYEFDGPGEAEVVVEFTAGKHFWYPQIAIWLEDTSGAYLKTLFVTEATATGVFYGSRTKENFRLLDRQSIDDRSGYRRVDALPYWSRKRGFQYPDGGYSPTREQPLPDAISGATPSGNFTFRSPTESQPLRLMVEVNVAFDENRYYSEFDHPDDEVYHSGAGLMGQPSLIYGATFLHGAGKQYKIMELLGRGHHSGGDGKLYHDLETITTAGEIFEKIVVGFKP